MANTAQLNACFQAVRSNDEVALKDMLPGVDINARSTEKFGHQRAMLHVAAATGSLEATNILIDHKANVNAKDKFRRTPLFLAARNGFADIVTKLQENGADIHIEDSSGSTALSYAISQKEWDIVKLLGGDVKENAPGLGGVTEAERRASVGTKVSMVDLVKAGIMRQAHGNSAMWQKAFRAVFNALDFWRFVRDGNTTMVKVYLENKRASVDVLQTSQDGLEQSALHMCAENGRLGTARCLISAGAEINRQDRKNRTPLHYAAINGHILLTNFLLENKCDGRVRDIRGRLALDYAIENENFDIVHLIREATGIQYDDDKDASVCVKRVLSVWEAARLGDMDTLKQAFDENSTDTRAKNTGNFGHQRTLLHCACATGKMHVIEYLLGKGADPNSRDSFKRTPIFLAARNDHYSVVKLLLSKGADPLVVDRKGKTAADIAASQENFRCVALLDPNFQFLQNNNEEQENNTAFIEVLDPENSDPDATAVERDQESTEG